jgi:hypothetical protein
MTTNHDIMRRQEQIIDHLAGITDFLAEISESLTQLALVATEYGIHAGFLERGRDERTVRR